MFQEGGKSGTPDLRTIYEANSAMLLRVAFPITGSVEAAQDIVQDAFAKLVEKDMRFPGPDDARYWLIRVVKNAALNHAKRKGREERAYGRWWRTEAAPVEDAEAGSMSLAVTGTEAGVEPAADEEMLRRETVAEVRAALGRLPEKLKTVLVLKEYGGMNYREIGKVMGISEGNVKVRAFRAREALLRILGEHGADVS